MSALERYRNAKFAQADALCDLGLIGQRYEGGGGGIGKITSLSVAITIYHQYRDGSTNYHKDNAPLNEALSKAAAEMAGPLIERAKAILQENVDQHKEAARKEYEAEFAAVNNASSEAQAA